MQISRNYSLIIWWILIPLSLILFSVSVYNIVRETKELDSKDLNSNPSWNSSTHPKADFFKLLTDFKKETNWDQAKSIYKDLVKEDPNNGYIDALAIKILLEGSYEINIKGDTEVITIKNEKNTRQAIKHFKTLLHKKEYNKYSLEYVLEARKDGKKSYLEMFKDISAIYSIHFPELGALRNIAKIYFTIDKPSPEELLSRTKTIKSFADKLITESDSIIELLVGAAIAGNAANALEAGSYQKQELKDLKDTLKQYSKLKGSILDTDDSMMPFIIKFSKLAGMTIPSMPAPDNFEEKLKVNRLLEYSYFDRMAFSVILSIFSLVLIALSVVIFRWKLAKINSDECRLQTNQKTILTSILITISVLISYTIFRDSLGSKQIGISRLGFLNIPYYSDFAALLLLVISLPVLLILKSSKNEHIPPVKVKSLYITSLIGASMFILAATLPYYENSFLMSIFISPWIFILFYIIKYFYLLFKRSEKEFNYVLSKLLIIYLSFTGLFIALITLPLIKISESNLYENDQLLRPAYELGYALPYAEAQNLIRVKGLLTDLDNLPEYKNIWKKETKIYKLKIELYKPAENIIEDQTQDLSGRRSRRSRILKAR